MFLLHILACLWTAYGARDGDGHEPYCRAAGGPGSDGLGGPVTQV